MNEATDIKTLADHYHHLPLPFGKWDIVHKLA